LNPRIESSETTIPRVTHHSLNRIVREADGVLGNDGIAKFWNLVRACEATGGDALIF